MAARTSQGPRSEQAKIRVLHVITDLEPGGAENMLKRLMQAYRADAAFEHRVLSLRTMGQIGAELMALGIGVKALGIVSPARLPSGLAGLWSEIASFKPDVVHTWLYHADLLGGLIARAAGKPVIWSVRSTTFEANKGASAGTVRVRKLCARLSRHVPARIAYVAHAARTVHEGMGYDRRKGMILPNGYPLPPRPSDQELARYRTDLGLGENDILIGSAGRFDPLKDHRGFIRACALIARKYPDAHFVLAGSMLAESPEVGQWISETGYQDRFHLVGHRQDLGTLLAAMDVFCLHSIAEAFPNVVAEAMAAETPCVVTDVGDAALIVGDTGIVVAPSDPAGLAQAVEQLILGGAALRSELGRRGRERVSALFSMDSVKARYNELYREVVSERE